MSLNTETTPISGCHLLELPSSEDARGTFTKFFQLSRFPSPDESGNSFRIREGYLTTSKPGVIRGLHLQVPPSALSKIVICLAGEVFDVVVDLRLSSETLGQHFTTRLSASGATGMLVPPGCAHGFCVTSHTEATLLYLTTCEYAPQDDTGIRWDTAGVAWPKAGDVTISERDAALPTLHDFMELERERGAQFS